MRDALYSLLSAGGGGSFFSIGKCKNHPFPPFSVVSGIPNCPTMLTIHNSCPHTVYAIVTEYSGIRRIVALHWLLYQHSRIPVVYKWKTFHSPAELLSVERDGDAR